MSEPEIWTIKMANHPQDDFVRFSAYKALDLQKAELMVENARLKAENENAWGSARTYSRLWIEAKENKERLEAEVERLRKAGDYMADHLAHEFGTCPSIEAWNAAKEGKPSV